MNSEQPFPWSSLLNQFWGFDALRAHQLGPVETLCSGQDTIAVLPTGGGKSLCYQLPGLVRGGTTLVISPLIALMQDQLDDLKARGIHAFSLAGISHAPTLERILENTERCTPCFLFASPEKLKGQLVRTRLGRLDIRTVAVDEAHCISEWGHDFRPAYRHLSFARKALSKAAWGCFTATATERVVEDIRENLELQNPAIFRTSTRRDNLTYAVCSIRDAEAMLHQAVFNATGTGLVYVGTRFQAEKWASRLEGVHGGAEAYHAGLDADTRAQRLKAWANGDLRIIVCTNAFGMGIDKPDVRWVYHAYVPTNLESYVQEAGRAGRDGRESECVLFVHPEQFDQRLQHLKRLDPALLPINDTYQFIANQGQVATGAQPDSFTPFDVSSFMERHGHSAQAFNRSLQLLQLSGYFGKIQSVGETSLEVSFNANSQSELYDIAEAPTEEGTLAKHLAPSAAHASIRKKQSEWKGTGLAWHQILSGLRRLEEWGILTFSQCHNTQQIEWSQPRATGNVTIPSTVGTEPFARSVNRLNAFRDFLDASSCRQLHIAHYFGFEDAAPCGKCDNCLAETEAGATNELLDAIPPEGAAFDDVIRKIPPSRYGVFVQSLKTAEEGGQIRFEKRRIFKAE
jgi:ATP-dependent DNA helicase RecQ